jgi:hypothetical protein
VRRAAEALGRIGDQQALAELEAIKVPPDRSAIRAIDFAKILISYRLSLGLYVWSHPLLKTFSNLIQQYLLLF